MTDSTVSKKDAVQASGHEKQQKLLWLTNVKHEQVKRGNDWLVTRTQFTSPSRDTFYISERRLFTLVTIFFFKWSGFIVFTATLSFHSSREMCVCKREMRRHCLRRVSRRRRNKPEGQEFEWNERFSRHGSFIKVSVKCTNVYRTSR